MIGKVFYKYDINKRVYRDPDTGVSYDSPIHRLSFRKWYIIGETSRSWLMNAHKEANLNHLKTEKFSKKRDFLEWGYLTAEQVEDNVFIHDHCYKASERVGRLRTKDVGKLKKIMEILDAT